MKESISTISHGAYTAEISSIGATLATLKFEDKNLVEPRLNIRYFSGEILAPGPNRMADRRYSQNGETFELQINEIFRNNALHGLVFDKSWKSLTKEKDAISLEIILDDTNKYPGILELETTYELDDKGLLSTLTATNLSDIVLLYGASTHPYLTVPGVESVDEYFLQISANQVYLSDEER